MANDKPTYPSNEADKFIVRLPAGFRERLAESARSNGRSMNSEVVERLLRSYLISETSSLDMEKLREELANQKRLSELLENKAAAAVDMSNVLKHLQELQRDAGIAFAKSVLAFGDTVRGMYPLIPSADQARPEFVEAMTHVSASLASARTFLLRSGAAVDEDIAQQLKYSNPEELQRAWTERAEYPVLNSAGGVQDEQDQLPLAAGRRRGSSQRRPKP